MSKDPNNEDYGQEHLASSSHTNDSFSWYSKVLIIDVIKEKLSEYHKNLHDIIYTVVIIVSSLEESMKGMYIKYFRYNYLLIFDIAA